jgi:hypothetical protein
MARDTPKVVQMTLSIQKTSETQYIPIGTEAWFAWLATAHVFAYHEDGASFTARKQHRRNHWYWYAYAKHDGQLHCRYLGRSSDLTPERLGSTLNTLHERPAPPLPRYTAKAYGPRARQSLQSQHNLAQLYSICADPVAPQLVLDRVRRQLNQLVDCFAERQYLGTTAGRQLLDLAEELIAALENERVQADQTLTVVRQLLHEAQAHSIQQRGIELQSLGHGEVF